MTKLNSKLNRDKICKLIAFEANSSRDFFVRIISSSLIATFGLANNSAPAIIGGMLLAPLMLPLRGVALGAIEGNVSLIIKSIRTIFWGAITSVVIAYLVTIILGLNIIEPASIQEVSARVSPTILDLCVAIVAGAIGGYAAIYENFSDTAAGTAIAVSLVPPLCVIGMTFAQGKGDFAIGAFSLFLINIIGIALACTIAFWIFGPFDIQAAARNKAMYIFCTLLFIIGVPLAVSFSRLAVITFIENEAKVQLLTQTQTFDEGNLSEDITYELLSIDPTWVPLWKRSQPNEIVLTILAMEKVSPNKINNSLSNVEDTCQDEGDENPPPQFLPSFSSTFPLTPKTLGYIENNIEKRLEISRPFKMINMIANEIDVRAKVEKIQVIEPCDWSHLR